MAVGAQQHGHQHALPTDVQKQHAECHTGDPTSNHNTCSSDCDTLQRATMHTTIALVELELKTAWPLMAVLRDKALRGLEAEVRVALWPMPEEARNDSDSVLHKTARLRL